MLFNACIMVFLGIFSSVFGSMLPYVITIKNKKSIEMLYELVSGIMVGIVCINLIPESIVASNIWITLIGIMLGTFFILLTDKIILKKNGNSKLNKLAIIIFSMAFHNILEGISVGVSLNYSISFGITVFLAMFLHDIPEGMIIGIAGVETKKSKYKMFLESFVVGVFSGIGIFIGIFLGSISDIYTGLFLSISSGAMLYVVTKTLIPADDKDHIISLSFIAGIILSVIISVI